MISQTSATMKNINHLPCMEGKDELCFISSAGRNQRVSCNIFGNLSSTNTLKGWEVWRFSDLQDGQVVVSSWTHHKKVLCSNPEGEVYTTENKKGDWERWIILKKSSGGVLIQSVSHERVLCISDKGHLRTVPTNGLSTSPENCLWSLDPGHCGKFFITNKACSRRISCNQKFDIFFSKNRKAWEAWTLEKFEFGGISVKSEAHGESRYLACTKEGRATTIGYAGHSVWTVLQSPNGGVSFLDASNKLLLSCTEDGNLATKAVDGDDCKVSPWETWMIEPDMPGTISGPQIWGLAGVSLACAIAAPFAVVGAVSAIGFEAGGIAAGSMAAGMMSAEAIAAGGGLVAGGTVATMQSIGAAGLSVAGATAASTGGAVLGAGVAAASAAGVSKLSAKEKKKTTAEARQEEATNRPFASWRSWDVKNE